MTLGGRTAAPGPLRTGTNYWLWEGPLSESRASFCVGYCLLVCFFMFRSTWRGWWRIRMGGMAVEGGAIVPSAKDVSLGELTMGMGARGLLTDFKWFIRCPIFDILAGVWEPEAHWTCVNESG